VNQGNLISILLALVMIAMGMTLESKDFTALFSQRSHDDAQSKRASWTRMISVGVACQYGIMPLAAWAVGHAFLLPSLASIPSQPQDVALFLGLILVGSAPGGTASNLVALIAGADVALSVILTAISTVLASFVTPLMVQLLVGKTILIQGQALCIATAQVVLLPVVLGMILKAQLPTLARFVSRFASFASVLFVSLICGGVVSSHADLIQQSLFSTSTGSSQLSSHSLLPRILICVCTLHTLGFFMGYIIPRFVIRLDEKTARTMSVETGMQNSALAVVLAKSVGADPIACLPGAFSATVHRCLGSLLAVYWRWKDRKEKNKSAAI
jgi:BASS family bile acid:Na+ symporter